MAQADAPEPHAVRLSGARFLQGRYHVHPGGLQSRGQPEQHARQDGQRRRRGQHVPVRLGMQAEVRFSIGQQRCEKRIPHTANSTPAPPPRSASSTLSVSNCLTMRIRLAPTLRRSAISRLRAAARASSRFATFAQASARINPTSASRINSGCEYSRRRVSMPPAPSLTSSSGIFADVPYRWLPYRPPIRETTAPTRPAPARGSLPAAGGP